MRIFKRKTQIVAIVFLVLFLSACFNVRIIENVKSPDRYFKKAYGQIEEIHRRYPDRERRPDTIQILIYEEKENKIVKVSTPIWLANGCLDLGMWAAEKEGEINFEGRYDFDWSDIRDLSRIGSGLLVEIEDEKNKVLIWLK
ncbi:MAG: hypothetical protein JSV96_15290 [Candidatus Aminicenantes bacterium]|nr:MAG: hypothetical protein JSV96_15290 [Candidatus Aminicenantes bacterium]